MALEKYEGHTGLAVIFEPGDLLVRQGTQADRIYHIHDGTVDILQQGRKAMSVGPDNLLGAEPLFFPGEKYLYSARAVNRVRGVEYAYSDILDMLADQTGLPGKLLFSMSLQLSRLWQDRQASSQGGKSQGGKNDLYYSGEVRCYFRDQWGIREG
ncbi:MAG: cyclic nucleotide-binding domain-containing protein, partial [Desulfonatronovibrionaceae bacterium]